jgi:2-amino-4-hydroxy-6-hydroxymethyldihydropteridine diphosphokinase
LHVTLHPLVERAAYGELPTWAVASPERREHLAHVATLLGSWAAELTTSRVDGIRLSAAGYLHDVLRDAEPETLRRCVPPDFSTLAGPLLHGPAAAERLRLEGVEDGELLTAVAYHTLGHARLGVLGRALYVADFLDPGRTLLNEWRDGLRSRMPRELHGVVREILAVRIAYATERGRPLRPETVGFWNSMATEG